ncbi:hypothetical protein [Streptomyces olivochromogenes]|uniref:hypothetical protein n=1 Tax=Streptomyces olivochromogenes TaxID=1963 RepID=UPI001F316439|nr:hypothetical protein [Streptomyces olivochromogenes]
MAEAFAARGAAVAVASRKRSNVDAAVKQIGAHGGVGPRLRGRRTRQPLGSQRFEDLHLQRHPRGPGDRRRPDHP